MSGNICRGKRTVNGFKVMGEGVSNYVRITRNLLFFIYIALLSSLLTLEIYFQKSQGLVLRLPSTDFNQRSLLALLVTLTSLRKYKKAE